MKKGMASMIWIVGLIVVAFAMSSGTFRLFSVVTTADACKYALPEKATISCGFSGFRTDSVNSSADGMQFTVGTADATIIGSTADAANYQLTDSQGVWICGTKVGTSLYGFPENCAGRPLLFGRTYSYKTMCSFIFTCPVSTLSWQGKALLLKYSDAEGNNNVDIPGTWNCITNDFSQAARNINLVGKNGASVIDSTTQRSISLQYGSGVSVPAGYYKEIVPLTTITYQDKPAICHRDTKLITGFSKQTAFDGTCYAIEDSGIILKDGRNDPYFACSSADCQIFGGLSSDYVFSGFSCVKKDQVKVPAQCIVNSDCGQRQYITDQNGQTVQRDFYCAAGTCQQSDSAISCNPALAYPNNQCCQKDVFGKYSLNVCQNSLKLCQSLGTDACCLDTQASYTVSPAPNGRYCCEIPKDGGVGKVVPDKNACLLLRGDTPGSECGFLGLGCIFNGLFAGLAALGIWIIAVLVIIAVIVIGRR